MGLLRYDTDLPMNESLRLELLSLRDADTRRREELLKEGTLFDGYHPRMEEVHLHNAARLKQIIAACGWPTVAMVGEDGAEAAWIIVQHAISDPPFQREMLGVLKDAAALGLVPAYQPAYLEDRICACEGRPQIYGTQFMPGDDGLPVPEPIADPDRVNQRRASIGLDSIEERTAKMREASSPSERPKDLKEFQRDYENWLRRVGWRK